MEDKSIRLRAKRKYIKVTFPNGKTFCYANVTNTFIAVLKEIGSERFSEIKLELGHLPLISQKINSKYKAWMKPIGEGWYVNTQSDTNQKYIQLRSISDSLSLNLNIEIGEDLEKQKYPNNSRNRKAKEKLLVRFSDGEYVGNENAVDTFLECLWKMDVEAIMRKGIEIGGSPLISTSKLTSRHIQVGSNRWVKVPNSTRDKAKALRILALHLKYEIEITIL